MSTTASANDVILYELHFRLSASGQATSSQVVLRQICLNRGEVYKLFSNTEDRK